LQAAYLYERAQKESKVVEMTAKGIDKQTHTYFAQPKTIPSTPVSYNLVPSADPLT